MIINGNEFETKDEELEKLNDKNQGPITSHKLVLINGKLTVDRSGINEARKRDMKNK